PSTTLFRSCCCLAFGRRWDTAVRTGVTAPLRPPLDFLRITPEISEGTELPDVESTGRTTRGARGDARPRRHRPLPQRTVRGHAVGRVVREDRSRVHRHPVLLLVPDAVGGHLHGADDDRVPAVEA